jgi:PAS domain S-box-containing protein
MRRCIARFSLLLLMLSSTSAFAARPRHVLLLYSFNRDISSFQAFAEEFRTQVTRGFREEVVFYEVASQPAPSNENPDEQPTLHYLTSMFAKHQLDLVATVGGPAAAFATKHRQELFPETPLLLAAVDERYVKNAALTANDAVVAVRNDVQGVIENIRHVLPHTSTIFLVIGNSPHEQFWRKQIDGELQQFRSQLQFVWLNDLSFPEMLKRCASLPPNSAIFYVLLSVDSEGTSRAESVSLSRLHAEASAPIFGVHRTQLGYGIVGGPLMSMDDLGSVTAGVAIRMLNGEVPANIKTNPQLPGTPVYDWRELSRWNIGEDRLPPESIVLFRDPGVWERYKSYIAIGGAIFVVQSLLIVALLANRSKRRRAEAAVRESRDRLSAILGTAVEGIVVTDENGSIESVNIGLEKMFGYGQLELAGQNVSSLMANVSFSSNETGVNMEAQGTRKDGSAFPVAVAVSEVELTGRRIYTGFVRDISERKRTEQLAREFGLQLIQAQDAERARIARELHDDIIQRLARLAIDAGRVHSAPDGDQHNTIHEIHHELRRLSKDLHSLAYRLHPSLLESLGLANAIRMDCERFSRQHSISVHLELGDIPRVISEDAARCLLRVTQEALQNVASHARVESAEVMLRQRNQGLQLIVRDKGVGFQVEQNKSRRLGLASMRERLGLLEGRFDIESTPGQGTMLLAWIPLRNLSGDQNDEPSSCAAS